MFHPYRPQRKQHSERVIGYPILKDGNPAGVQSVYTERQPCQDRTSWCDQRLASMFRPNSEVTHSHSYDQTPGPDGKQDPNKDREHKAYIRNLRKWHKQHALNAGMMTESDGAALKAVRKR
ncbi:nucleic acid/nucleotide deaminase domain-containing protein [Streptomyces thermoviolaceus]|uniref:nucleic acid/nucleotide deaminase domain-containing protein n=1 Tax=Streptomyces thermoviolaceus TaxID=1952 RepID=UPI0033B8E3DF